MADDTDHFDIDWIDSGREPQNPPDPAFPDGVDVASSIDTGPTCYVALPYPARRCGAYTVRCRRCGFTAVVTTAGRPDDPRSITVPCKEVAH